MVCITSIFLCFFTFLFDDIVFRNFNYSWFKIFTFFKLPFKFFHWKCRKIILHNFRFKTSHSILYAAGGTSKTITFTVMWSTKPTSLRVEVYYLPIPSQGIIDSYSSRASWKRIAAYSSFERDASYIFFVTLHLRFSTVLSLSSCIL